MPARHRPERFLNCLRARYDAAALRPPEASAQRQPDDHEQLQALRDWCLAGTLPRTTVPWAVTALELEPARAARVAAQLCLERDGSWQLAACRGASGRYALRLKTKAQDLMPWRDRQPDDPWDSGYVIDTPAGLQALARFTPRRATLIVAQGLAAAVLGAATEGLAARQSAFTQPVRLLALR